MIFNRTVCVGLVFAASVVTAVAQTPNLQDLQNKLLQFEEASQKTIADLKAQIAALQQGQNRPGAVPLRRLLPRRPKFQ